MKRTLVIMIVISLLFGSLTFASASGASDFSDVPQSIWFHRYVDFVVNKGLFNGTGSTTFSPSGTMTRGMFVTVLGRHAGVSGTVSGGQIGVVLKNDVNMRSAPSTVNTTILDCLPLNAQVEYIESCADLDDPSYTWSHIVYKGVSGYIRNDLLGIISSVFSDVSPNMYYAPYVEWAFSSGIAYESGAGTFSPNAPITREDICSMLFNFTSYKNMKLKPTVAAKDFTDSYTVHQNYRTAVSMMQQIGVIDGYEDRTFKPSGSASRAEVSAMLTRYIAAMSYTPDHEPSYDENGNYIFGSQVPEKSKVGNSYFDDACFIGHSLVVGMKNYLGLNNSDFFCFNGAHTRSILSSDEFPISGTRIDEDGNTVPNTGTLSQSLSEKSYGKVYIMLGANEVGGENYHKNNYYNNMSQLISLVKSKQPGAIIYLISMTPVSEKCSDSRTDINRDNIVAFNGVIKKLCQDNKLYYLNVFDVLANENGFLNNNQCMDDGIHILGPAYLKIKNYLFTHTV